MESEGDRDGAGHGWRGDETRKERREVVPCHHRTKTRLMSRSLQHWWASAMSSMRCEAGVSMQCTMWSTRSPRMLGWHHSDTELMRTWLVQCSFTLINIPFLTCLRNMVFLSLSSIF